MQRYGHILLIEDDLDLAAMLIDYLSGCGFDVVHAVSAERGIACYRTDKFDILIVDIQLPKWDGFQFVEYVSKLNKNQFVLFLTARLSKTDKLRGLHLGGNDYITKPFDVEELAFVVDVGVELTAFEVEDITAFELELEADEAKSKISVCAPSIKPYREL